MINYCPKLVFVLSLGLFLIFAQPALAAIAYDSEYGGEYGGEFYESEYGGQYYQYGSEYGVEYTQYAGQYGGEYTGQYAGQYGGEYTGQYGGEYTGEYGGEYGGQYGGQYGIEFSDPATGTKTTITGVVPHSINPNTGLPVVDPNGQYAIDPFGNPVPLGQQGDPTQGVVSVVGVVSTQAWADYINSAATFTEALDRARDCGCYRYIFEDGDGGGGAGALLPGVCDTTYFQDNFHVCFFDTTNPDTGPYIIGWNEPNLPSPTGGAVALDHNWGTGQVDATNQIDTVSGIWRGRINFQAGVYIFSTLSDDGVRVDLEGFGRIIDNWTIHGPTIDRSVPITLPAGYRNVTLRWFENDAGAVIKLWWELSPPPTCTVDLVPSPLTLVTGQTQPMVASILSQGPAGSTIDEVHFSSNNPAVVSVSPDVDNTYSYTTNANAVSAGSATLTSTVHMSSPGFTHVEACTDTATVTVTQPGPWFQTKDADIWAFGDVRSPIPPQCTAQNQCTPQFCLPGPGGFPGVVAYGGTGASFGAGVVSNKGWLANSGYAGRRFDYSWFSRLAPPEVFTDQRSVIGSDSISGGELISGYEAGGYVWRYRSGDLVINGAVNLGGRKVILFVSGNMIINGRITLNPGEGFFLLVSRGEVRVDPSVSHPNQPALEGLFVSDGAFRTGTKFPTRDERLYIRGSIVSWTGIDLQRDLDPSKTSGDNNKTPAEFLEFAPDLFFTFPRDLARVSISWQEVAP